MLNKYDLHLHKGATNAKHYSSSADDSRLYKTDRVIYFITSLQKIIDQRAQLHSEKTNGTAIVVKVSH